MTVTFEDQIAWVRAEAKRIRDTYGDRLALEAHLDNPVWGAGVRAMTLWDPASEGSSAAVCITATSEEGTSWRAELRPLIGADDAAVPDTKTIGSVELEIRYGRCVRRTDSQELGATSGEGGKPDLGDAIASLVAGDIKVAKKRSFGGKTAAPYASR